MKTDKKALLGITGAMAIFGTIGLFRQMIPYPSSVIAEVRGLVGVIFLLLVVCIRGQKLDRQGIRRNLPMLCLSGLFLGSNWILLFEAYRFTQVSTATLCYYMAPVIVILVSPILFRERLTWKKGICALAAMLGMVIVSGVLTTGIPQPGELKGILFGLGAAGLYAAVVILNKQIQGLESFDRTIMQLGISAVCLLPYVLLTEDVTALPVEGSIILLLLVVGILHTGVAYALYFGSIGRVPAQTAAIFSYLDPVIAILLAALILQEHMAPLDWLGSGLILGAAVISELPEKKSVGKAGD